MNENREMLRNALDAIESLQLKLKRAENAATQPIAVVGCGLRYPGGVETLEDFRQLLENRVDAVRRVPEDRWDADAYYSPDRNALGKILSRNGGFLDQIDQFDPATFGISPREAKSLDPQHRLLLETAHEAMESAAIAPDSLTGSHTGVFVGISTNEYARLMYAAGIRDSDVYAATGGALNAAAGRISFTYGFNGPCVAVDTACSSSLNAIHLACQSLRRGESDLALAGGVAVIAMPDAMVMFSRWGMLSPDGACKTFDASANGFARGEGCGMIALKRLSDAQADGNPILGVIIGTATNSDGRSSGMTVPNGPAQERMLKSALDNAGLKPVEIDYIEAHGTGTPIGDPIEVGALGSVLCDGRDPAQPLRIGSLKTNIGHAEAAAGVGSLLKVIACMKSETIYPQLHFNQPNPGIDWDRLPLKVVSEAEPWPRRDTPRRAGVSAFGFSGTNVHVILQDPPAPAEAFADAPDAPLPVVLSAGTDSALRDLAGRHADFLDGRDAPSGVGLARTLAEGRSHLARRTALVARNAQEMRAGLRAIAEGTALPGTATGIAPSGAAPRVAFLCTGQGSQYAGMAQGLYEAEPVFRASIDRSAAILVDVLAQPLTEVLFPSDPDTSPISETAYTQPALFAVEYAMAELWESWGVTPSVVLGHSIGEYVAACLAGVMGHEQALRLVAERGRLMQQLPEGGAMAAVFAPEAQVAKAIRGRESTLAIAGINAPEETVISGSAEAVDAALAQFEADGISANRLTVSHAFHSPLLDPMLDPFESFAAGFDYNAPHIPLVSNLTGTVFGGGQAPDATYWRDHARGAVRFADCVAALEAAGADILIEIGPHPALLGLAARARTDAKWRSVPTLRRGQDAQASTMRALTEAYAAGIQIDWPGVFHGRGGRLIQAPTYPFQRERYWFDAPEQSLARQADVIHPLLGAVQQTPPPNRAFLNTLDAGNPPYLADHTILDHVIFPATGCVEMALAAAKECKGEGPVVVEGLSIDAPLSLPQGEMRAVHTDMTRGKDGAFELTIREIPADPRGEWRTLARLSLKWNQRSPDGMPDGAEAARLCDQPVDIGQHYAELAELGVQYGPAFLGLAAISKGDGIAVATVDLSRALPDLADYRLHPALLDSAFHAVSAIVANREEKQLYLPVSIDAIHWWRNAPARVRVVAKLRHEDESEIVADLLIETEDGRRIAQIDGLHARVASASALEQMLAIEKIALQDMTLSWEDVPRATAGPVGGLLVLGAGGEISAGIAAALEARLATAADLPEMLTIETPDWVVDCAAADAPSDGREVYGALLQTVQTIDSIAPSAGLCVVTRGARRIRSEEAPDPAAAVTVGLCHVIDMERRTAPLVQLDLDPFAPVDPQAILGALTHSATDPELALRAGGFVAPRLRPVPHSQPRPESSRKVLRFTERGDLDRLHMAEEPRTTPGKGEVEIAVRATGLNFRDVLNALGMYPGDPGRMGSECAGVIARVGEGVEGLKPGDPVVALAGDSLASHVTVSDRFVLPKPDQLGFADAVTVPNTYLTAALCYATAGGIQPGQRVLVHAAAGGVGIAAMRLAVRAGAEVIATAGSAAKRAVVLREGAKHAFDSRSASFGDAVMEVTGGEGVDMVINALSGEMIEAGMRVTKPGGAFLEIGKNNIWTTQEASERAPHVRYSVVDLGEQIVDDAAEVRRSFQSILSDIEAGLLAPLPVHAFPLEDAREAYRFMANARHMGKIALMPEPDAGTKMTVRPDGTYLVTGGLAGIGLAAAERLAVRGAGEVILVGRSGDGPAAQEAAAELAEATGTTVRAVACDVSDAEAVSVLAADLAASALPLRGIIHAAGVLDDAPLPDQTVERFDRVAGPKVAGARNLLAATRQMPLDFVVLYSSSSAVLGSPGQANYAGANAWLDSIALRERAAGRPVTSVAWGAWGDVGMAARLSDTIRDRWKRVGLGRLGTEEALDTLEQAVGRDVPFAMIARLDLATIASKGSNRIRALLDQHRADAEADSDDDLEQTAQHILDADPAERPALLMEFVTTQVARVLGYSAAALDTERPYSDLGFDSLMAVQLRNSIRAALDLELSLRELLGGASAATTAAQLNTLLEERAGGDGDADDEVWEETVI